MKKYLKHISIITSIVIASFYSFITIQYINNEINKVDSCLCANDGFGYYMYLPSLINRGEIEINKNWAQSIQNKYCDSTETYQIVESKIGKSINIYHMGLSYIKLPSYIIANTIAKQNNYTTDGFSTPYLIAHHLNALLFILIGIYYLRKLLLRFGNELTSSITLLIIYFGTNFFATATIQIDLPHLYLFTLNAIFLHHIIKFNDSNSKKNLILSAIIFGLTTAIRPTQAVIGIIPLLLLYKKEGLRKEFWKQIILYPLFAVIINIPQFVYWQYTGGEPIILNLHTEDIVLTDPNLWNFLFSFRKGWILYTPIVILAFTGGYYAFKKGEKLFWPTTAFIILYIWILSSWECWWYAGSFGSRVMVDTYPLIAIFILFTISQSNNVFKQFAIGLISILCITLNIFQTEQLKSGIIDSTRMSKEHYLYTFGKSQINAFNNGRLLMDRSDKNWINKTESLKIQGQHFLNQTIFETKKALTARPRQDLTIGRFTILDKVPSDETQLTATFKSTTSNPNISSIIRLETVSKYNCYSWDNLEISKGTSKGDTTEHIITFNLPDIRHSIDEMQLYIDNDHDVTIDLISFKIDAKTLIRE